MKNLILTGIAVLLVIYFTACEKNEDENPASGYTYGIFVVNEGSFNSNNGSISYVNESNTLITNDIFYAANGRALGDIVQSMSIVNDSLAVIVVNNSAKLELVRLSTFQAVTAPVSVPYPRYFLPVSDSRGYVTSGNLEGKIYVTDLSSLQIVDSIVVGFGPEVMVRFDNNVYVANSGGWSSDSTISVINITSGEVDETIAVEKVPVDLAIDNEDYLWVYCKGYTNYSDIVTDSYLQKIDMESNNIIWQEKVGSASDYTSVPAKLSVSSDGKTIYYIRPDGIYKIAASDPVIQGSPLIAGSFYGLDVHPENGRIYVFESSFTGNGTLKIYESDGTLFAQGIVGIGPNSAVFNLP